MIRPSVLVFTGLLLAGPPALPAQSVSPQHEAIAFLAGEWNTLSVVPSTGDSIPGVLEYSWVLGGAWMRVEFNGDWPGRVWEAHVMMQWDDQGGAYRSFAFFGPGDPVFYSGEMVSETLFRVSHINLDGTRAGIDYRDNGDGTVYQENWVIDENGDRGVTLRTYYSPAGM